nr:MAG: hypothetical protein H3BulkLitter17783_000003 [Mitovirus sp.]
MPRLTRLAVTPLLVSCDRAVVRLVGFHGLLIFYSLTQGASHLPSACYTLYKLARDRLGNPLIGGQRTFFLTITQ